MDEGREEPSASASTEALRRVRVAVVQPRGYPFDTAGALEAIRTHANEAAREGARLVVFPEAFVGGYPWGLRFGTSIGGRAPAGKALFGRYWASAITLPGPESEAIGRVARDAGLHLAVGVIERLAGRASTLFCTLAWYGPDGSLLGIHRKLKPTAAERLIWGEGDGSTLPVIQTSLGRMGGLICWENYMPLARMALYGQGVELYLAPTADARERWQATLRHIAIEGRCFVLGCNQYVTRAHYPSELLADPEVGDLVRRELEEWPEELCRGGSVIVGPDGEILAGPCFGESGMLMAELDLDLLPRERLEFDVVGHYARPDIFRFTVDQGARPAVAFASPHEPGDATMAPVPTDGL